ncbi:hypothetical protein Micbo1qcDRAFT_174107 [Microdochium bolleyi]|uniref:BTB domain-containing protein n=1 Tax=Microdochium bolleyi TaxID=196109 RepID=A0A136J728_9PEZI|nr:hypothetical protein Micbo1qcDRAFT_174107 [Microdochium bolleyi]
MAGRSERGLLLLKGIKFPCSGTRLSKPDLMIRCGSHVFSVRRSTMRERMAWYRRIHWEESTQKAYMKRWSQDVQYSTVTLNDVSPERLSWALNYINTGDSNVERVLGFGAGFFGPYTKAYEVASFLGMPDLQKQVATDLMSKLSPVAAILQLEQNYGEIRDEGLVRTCGLTSAEFYTELAAAVRAEYHDQQDKNPDMDPLRSTLADFGARTYHISISDARFRRDLAAVPGFATDLRRRRWLVYVDGPYNITRRCAVCDTWLFEGGKRHIARAQPGKGDRGFICSFCVEQGKFVKPDGGKPESEDVEMY